MSKSRGSGLLITGILFFVIAGIFGGVAVMSMSSLKSGITGGMTSEFTPVQLRVNEPTTVELKPGRYGVWTDNPDARKPSGDSSAAIDFDEQLTEDADGSAATSHAKVTISGPASVEVRTPAGEIHVQNETQIGSFEITEPGEYTVSTTLSEEETTDWNYSIGQDAIAVVGDVSKGVMQFGMVILGGVCGGALGLIGLIFIMIYILRQ